MKVIEEDGAIFVRFVDKDEDRLEVDFVGDYKSVIIETNDFRNSGSMVQLNKTELETLIIALNKIHDRMT